MFRSFGFFDYFDNTFASFEIKNASKNYDVKIETLPTEDEIYGGKATVQLFLKNSKQIFQTFYSDELKVIADKPIEQDSKVVQLLVDQGDLMFGDFNFDGSEDLAIRNGNYGAYGGPVYDVYVFNKTKQKFVLSKELSALT